MKRTSLISAVALIAVVGSAGASFAEGEKDMGRRGGKMPALEMLDTDGDGQVSQAEMDAHKAERFAQTDTDGNGSLSAEEMAEAARGKKAERQTKRIEKMITRMDTDGDGEVSAAELDAMAKKSPFERLDTNGDGVLSADEFAAGHQGHGKGGKGGKHHKGGDHGHDQGHDHDNDDN